MSEMYEQVANDSHIEESRDSFSKVALMFPVFPIIALWPSRNTAILLDGGWVGEVSSEPGNVEHRRREVAVAGVMWRLEKEFGRLLLEPLSQPFRLVGFAVQGIGFLVEHEPKVRVVT